MYLSQKNIDIADRLVNGQVGTVMRFKLNSNNIISGIYVKLDDAAAGKQASNLDHMCRENHWTLIERAESTFDTRKNKRKHDNSLMVRRTQFPLTLSYACTSHKVQGLTLKSAVVSFELLNQRYFNEGQMYVSLSRVTDINGLFLIGEYNRNAIRVNNEAGLEYERLRNSCSLKNNHSFLSVTQPSDKYLHVSLLNVRSLKKHADDVKKTKDLISSDLLCLTETQLSLASDTSDIDQKLDTFKIEYNNMSVNRFQNSACCSNTSTQILECDKVAGFTMIKFSKETFSNKAIKLLLLYKPPNYSTDSFCEDLRQVTAYDDIDIIVGDFNIDALDPANNFLKDVLSSYEMIVNDPTHLAGGLLDHVYLKKSFISQKEVQCFVKDVYFSDHDGVCFSLLNDCE